jgi:hypothetical protein
VDSSQPGDEIRVATGIYTDTTVRSRSDITTTGVVTQTVYISKTVTLRGGYNTDFSIWNPDVYSTTLDAQGRGRGIYITGNISPVIEGLRITGGDATGLGGYDYYGTSDVGAGLYVMTATATLVNNQIFSNTARIGGGVYLGDSNSQFNGNIVSNNSVVTGGGGMFLYKGSATLNGNKIVSNTSNNLGGGLYLFSTNATLMNNRIAGNTANVLGGGVDVASCNPTFSGNIVSGNTAWKGGGLYLWYSPSILTNNVIADNLASSTGSGLWIGGSSPRLLHTTIARNTGGDSSGVYATDDGNGIFSTLAMTNTILVSQTVGINVTAGSSATLNGVIWYGNTANYSGAITVTNALAGDPVFGIDGYHLAFGSAAIDNGIPAGVLTDIDGQPRFSGTPDLGADEYWLPGYPKYLYLPIIMRNY